MTWATEAARQRESLATLADIEREARQRLEAAFVSGDDDALNAYVSLVARVERARSFVLLALNEVEARARDEAEGTDSAP